MIIKETKDKEEIKKILCHKDIFNLSKDGLNIKVSDFKPPLDDVVYIAGYEKGKPFGLAVFHRFKDGVKYHPNILKSHRRKYGRDFVKKTVSMLKCNIYIEFPKNRKDLFNLAIKFGFDSYANNKDSLRKITMVKKL